MSLLYGTLYKPADLPDVICWPVKSKGPCGGILPFTTLCPIRPSLRTAMFLTLRILNFLYHFAIEQSRDRPTIARRASFWRTCATRITFPYELPQSATQQVSTGSNRALYTWRRRLVLAPVLLSRAREAMTAKHFPEMEVRWGVHLMCSCSIRPKHLTLELSGILAPWITTLKSPVINFRRG